MLTFVRWMNPLRILGLNFTKPNNQKGEENESNW